MRIILFIVFYIATYVARIAISGDIAKTMPGKSMRYVLKQKSRTAWSGVSEMPIDDGIIQINKRNRQSLGNRIDGFPQSRRRNNLERAKRSLQKRRKCKKKSNCKIARRRNTYVGDNDVDEQNVSSNVMRPPVWQVPKKSTIPAINLDFTTNPTSVEIEMNNRSSLAFKRLPSQLGNLDYDRSVNEAVFPVAERHPNSRRLFDIDAANEDFILSKIANPKSEINIDVRDPAFARLHNKMLFPVYHPGTFTDTNSQNSSYQGFGKQYGVQQRDSSNIYKKELFNDRLTDSTRNERFLLVPVSKNLYVLKNVRASPRTNGIIVPKRYKLLEKKKDNATSAILSFKAHMHHDVKDIGRAYRQRGNHRLFDYNANYLYSTSNSRIAEETARPTENPVSYPDFLYPGIAFQTRSNLIDATPEISDKQIVSPVPDYANVSFADINSRSGIDSHDSSAFLSSSSIDIPNYDVFSKESANDDQPNVLSTTKLDGEINLFQQDSRNYGDSLGYSEFGIELTTMDFRDTFGTLDDTYTPATFEICLTNKEVFDVTSQNLEDDSKFSPGRNEDVTDFIDNISMQRAAFDANEDNTFLPNITYTFTDNAVDILNSEDMDKDSQEYGILIPGEYNNKKSTYSNDFDYNNISTDEALLNNNITDVDLSLNAEHYVTVAPLLPNTDEWPSKKAQSNVENSRDLIMAIKPLSSELQKLLSAVKLVNQSLSNVQNRLCNKKNVVRTVRENKDRKTTNIGKPNKVYRYNPDLFTETFNSQSLDKRRSKTKDGSIAERNVKIRRKINGFFLNKMTTPFHKRESFDQINNSEVQSGRRNFLKKRKLNEKKFPKSDNVEKRKLLNSKFNRNLKSLTKTYDMRGKSIRQFIEAGLKRIKRTTTPITSRFIKNNVSGKNNFAAGVRNRRRNDQISRSIISNNTPSTFLFTKDSPAHFLSARQDLQRNVKREMSSKISDKEKKISSTDPQFYKEATAYLDVLRLLGKTEKPHIEHVTDVWITQNLTESMLPPIFTTAEFSAPTLTFLPYFTVESTTLSTIAERKEAPEMTELPLYKYVTVTDLGYSKIYDERNYTRTYKDYEYEDVTSKISEIISLTQSPITLSTFTITMPTTLPSFYTTEITILPIDEAAILTTEKMTVILPVTIATEVITKIPITIPTIESVTIGSTMLLTQFLEDMTDITLKITIPAAKIEETPVLTEAKTVIIEKEIVESTPTTLATEIIQSLLVETDTSLYTFSTVSLFETIEAELTIKTTSPATPVSTNLTITKGFQTATSESTFGRTLYNITVVASSPALLESTETILSTSTEVAITILTPEDESPVTQIEKTITAEEITTEIPTTIETATPTKIIATTIKTSTAIEISTSIETATITEIVTINETLTPAETSTSTETSIASETSTIGKIPTIIETTTIMETLTPTEILTTFITPIIKETTSAKTLTPIETKTIIEISATTEISTSIETTTITEIATINKTLTTAETPTSIETPTASRIPTTTETTIITETLTPTEILTSIETKITTEISTITETAISTETITITENITVTITEASAFTETSTISEIPTTSTMIIETTATTETSTLTEIVTTIKIPTIKKTTSTKALTPTIMATLSVPASTETQVITETPTIESSGTTEISVVSTTYITTKFFTTLKSTMSSITTSPEKFFPSILTTFTTIFTTGTAENVSTSSITPVTTSVKTTVPTLKLTTIMPLQTLIANTTLSKTPYTIISSTFLTTTEKSAITSFKTAIPTTSLKVTTTTPLSLITSTMLSKTPSTTLSTFLVEETTASSIFTTSLLETLQTTVVLPISTTISTVLTTTSIAIYTTENATVFNTTASTITAEIFESTISPVIYFTTPSITKIPITVPIIVDTGTTAYETTSTSFFSTETIESTTSSIREYEEYYESTKEEIATVTSTVEFTTEEYTWITEGVTIVRDTTPTYLPSFITPSIGTTTEVTFLAIKTITLPTITEETLLVEKIVTITPITIEGVSTLSEVTITSTETSTMSAIETSSLVSTTETTASLLEETAIEITETSWVITTLLPTTERPEYATILEAAITVTLAPFSESILSILITSEVPATTPEIISVLPKTVSEEFTMSMTESPLVTYVTRSSTTSFIETMIHFTISISVVTTEETLEAETEYYVAKEPFEEEYEEYEEYDTEIPTGKWYYYDEYETTTKRRTTATIKYTKLPKEMATTPFVEGTTLYEIETSEFIRYSTPSEIISPYTNVTATISGISYTEEEVISTLETSSAIIENVTMVEAKAEFTSAASEMTESTTWLTFGSTEEYTLPTSTIFTILTEPLEYLTIPPKYTVLERFTQIWHDITSPKFITKPKKIPEIVLEKTTTLEVSTETEVTAEKLTSFFVSSTLTTLTEKEVFEVHTTTLSTAFFKTEGTIETGYEVTTLAMTEEEIIPFVTPFITSEAEMKPIYTTTITVELKEQKEQLLQRLEDLEKREREVADREERLKEKEKQWDIEKERCRKIMQREKEEAKNITIVTGTTVSYITTTALTTSPVLVSTKHLTESTTEIEVISLGPETFITTSSLVEITTIPTETIPFSITEEITYISEATAESIFITYTTEEMEEITDYIILTPRITTSIMDLYSIGLTSVETTTSYITEEMYTASYVSETIPFSITEEITAYTTEKIKEATTEESTSTIYTTEETVIFYTTEKSTSITYFTEGIEETQITDYIILTPYLTTSMELYNVGLASIETVTPYSIEEMYTTSYVTLYSETFASTSIISPITLHITTFSEKFKEVSVASVTTPTWYTTEETYTAIYTDIYSKPLFTSPALEFTSTTISSTLATITTTEIKYDEEIERLKEKLREKERELEEREKILLGREKRLEEDIVEFEKYMEEFEKKITSSRKSTVLTSLSTPMPPTERTIVTAQLTTIKSIAEKKENRTTTKMLTSQQIEMEEKKRTQHVPEETVAWKEEEIATKRICLNVLKNTTIPLDKRRNIATKKVCLPYFPEKNEEKKSVGRLSRRLFALQNTRKIRKSKWNVPLDFRCRRRVKETTRKIDNLQLSHHEWLSNETTKPLRHFKGFTRIYKKMKKHPKKVANITDMRGNATSDFQDKTSLYEHVLNHESIFQPTATSMLDSDKHRKRNAFFRYDLISARENNFLIDDKANVRKRDVSPIENDARFWSRKNTVNISRQRTTTATAEENGFYTVNVLHLSYNKDKETHEVISAKPEKDELTAILSESNDDNYVSEFGEDRKITMPNYEIEEEDNLKEDKLADKTEKKIEEDDEDYIEDMIDNYMNYEEHETSTWTHDRRLLDDRGKDKRMTENERISLNKAWPTERSTTYHLGGTKFWELDFVTEPSTVSRTTIDKSKTIDVSITRTTCFDVVLKNERNNKVKSNISYRKRDVYSDRLRKNGFIGKRNASLRNVTRKNALRHKPRTNRSRVRAKKLKRDSQKLHGLNYSKRSSAERKTMRFNDFQRTGNEDSIIAKSRKLCGINASKSKHQIVNHEDATDKHKKKKPAKSRALQDVNLHSLHNTNNCVINKKNHLKTTTIAKSRIKKTDDKSNDEKITHLNKNKLSALHEKKIHNCINCICDIASIVNNMKSLLDRVNFPLDEIKTLNCSEYKEIQDKIVISMDSDMEEAREFPQPHYNIESLKGQKYIKLEELEDNFKSDLELDGDHDVVSLPGLNLNLPCNQDGDGITWLSSVNRPSYTWKRTDGIALFGFVAENGDLELRNVNAKDTGNYTCVMTYMSPDNEEPVETAYEIHLQVVTLPRYVVHGESRYHVRSCDEKDLDVLVTYLPLKLNSLICEADVCNAYVLTPSCSRSQITVNILLVPSHIVKLMTIDPKHCNVFCLKAIQDKLSLILSKNLQIFLEKTIIFRLPHYEQRLVPIVEKSSFTRWKRGKTDANAFARRPSNVGLFSSCPAGYGLRDTRCVPCNMGTYSDDGISHCKRCPPGTYQPNHGARVCRACTNPMTKGCYNMLWNSFSAVMVTLASVGAMLLICLLLIWIICCAKKKFCVKRIAGIVAKEDAFESKKRIAEEQSLIKDASENEDQQLDSEYRVKRKKGKFYVNKKRRKQNERRKYGNTHAHEDEWGSHRIKTAPITCPDSYQSHEDYNYYPKRSYRKGPRLPECDFDT